MKTSPVTLAIVIGVFMVALACVIVDHSLAATVVGLLGTVVAAQAPALVQKVRAVEGGKDGER
jgi:hypothetical protein